MTPPLLPTQRERITAPRKRFSQICDALIYNSVPQEVRSQAEWNRHRDFKNRYPEGLNAAPAGSTSKPEGRQSQVRFRKICDCLIFDTPPHVVKSASEWQRHGDFKTRYHEGLNEHSRDQHATKDHAEDSSTEAENQRSSRQKKPQVSSPLSSEDGDLSSEYPRDPNRILAPTCHAEHTHLQHQLSPELDDPQHIDPERYNPSFLEIADEDRYRSPPFTTLQTQTYKIASESPSVQNNANPPLNQHNQSLPQNTRTVRELSQSSSESTSDDEGLPPDAQRYTRISTHKRASPDPDNANHRTDSRQGSDSSDSCNSYYTTTSEEDSDAEIDSRNIKGTLIHSSNPIVTNTSELTLIRIVTQKISDLLGMAIFDISTAGNTTCLQRTAYTNLCKAAAPSDQQPSEHRTTIKKLIRRPGMKAKSYDCSINCCFCYYKSNLTYCPNPKCNELRFKVNIESKMYRKTFEYISLIERLKLQFSDPKRAKELIEYRQELEEFSRNNSDVLKDYWTAQLYNDLVNHKGLFQYPETQAYISSTDGFRIFFRRMPFSAWPLLLIALNIRLDRRTQ